MRLSRKANTTTLLLIKGSPYPNYHPAHTGVGYLQHPAHFSYAISGTHVGGHAFSQSPFHPVVLPSSPEPPVPKYCPEPITFWIAFAHVLHAG